MISSSDKDSTTIKLKDGACSFSDNLSEAAHDAGRRVRSILHTANDDISHASDYVSAEIRSNPVRSGIIALGVGVLLGALLRR